jgi:hypothetical protein
MLILLDIDGVMLPAKPWSSLPLFEDGFYDFNKKSVAALNKLLLKTEAKIILTTSHKYKFSLKKWVTIFVNRGIHINTIDRLNENTDFQNRASEIKNWLSSNITKEKFVIIDDDKSLNDLPKYIKKHLVQTKPLIGLRSDHVADILKILEEPMQII